MTSYQNNQVCSVVTGLQNMFEVVGSIHWPFLLLFSRENTRIHYSQKLGVIINITILKSTAKHISFQFITTSVTTDPHYSSLLFLFVPSSL